MGCWCLYSKLNARRFRCFVTQSIPIIYFVSCLNCLFDFVHHLRDKRFCEIVFKVPFSGSSYPTPSSFHPLPRCINGYWRHGGNRPCDGLTSHPRVDCWLSLFRQSSGRANYENKLVETGSNERAGRKVPPPQRPSACITFARSVDRRSRICSPARLSREGLLAV